MKTKLFRNKLLRKTLASWCAFATLATTTSPVFAGSTVCGGSEWNNASGNLIFHNNPEEYSVDIGIWDGSSVGVIDWKTFNINSGYTYTFNPEGKAVDGATYWNIVTGMATPSQIDGILNGNANANVYILNPYGIAFGAGSQVNVGGIFAAAAMGMTSDDFKTIKSDPAAADWDGKIFAGTGSITVDPAATISASSVTLAGNGVTLEGAVTGPVNILSGNELVVDQIGPGNVSVTFDLGDSSLVDINLMGTFTDDLTAKAAGTVTVTDDPRDGHAVLSRLNTALVGMIYGGDARNILRSQVAPEQEALFRLLAEEIRKEKAQQKETTP